MRSSYDTHNPFHLPLDHRTYWFSASTWRHARILDREAMSIWHGVLVETVRWFQAKLYGWVILPDHYHLLFGLGKGNDLSQFAKRLNGKSSFEINRAHSRSGRKIWHQYWDRVIRNEADFYTRLNYLYQNPVKHGCVAAMVEYEFSSFRHYLKTRGEEWISDVFERFPVIDFTPDDEP